jgi:hypothetical protein
MSRDRPDPDAQASNTSTEGQDSGKPQDQKAIPVKSIKPLNLENIKADWKNIGDKVRELNHKINQDVLKNVEKLENIHYQNMKNADAIKQKIEQEWEAFEESSNSANKARNVPSRISTPRRRKCKSK